MKKFFFIAGIIGLIISCANLIFNITKYINAANANVLYEFTHHLSYIMAIISNIFTGPVIFLFLIYNGKQKGNKEKSNDVRNSLVSESLMDNSNINYSLYKFEYDNTTNEICIYNDKFCRYFKINKIKDIQIYECEVSFIYSHKTYFYIFESIEDINRLQEIIDQNCR